MASRYGKMALSMTVNGKATKQMVQELSFMQMEIFMKASGCMTKHMDTEPTSMLTEQPTLANGLKINNMVPVSRSGQMVPSTKECIWMARSIAMAH